MNRTLCRALLVAGSLAVVAIAAGAQATGDASRAKPKLAEEQFKNIQVLKGIPADQLIPTMQFVGASLGVDCDFCHVERAFEKDDQKPKQTARKMMQMMFAINKDNFEGQREVTCYSCHRGGLKPAAIPVVMSTDSTAGSVEAVPLESAEGSLPAADQIIEKYIQALGGADAIKKISSRVQKGKAMGLGDEPVAIDVYTKAPGKRISFMHLPGGDSVTAYNGKEGWTGSAGRPAREMHSGDLDAAAMDADLQFSLHIQQRFLQLKAVREEKIAGRPTYVVEGTRDAYPPVELCFDKGTGLLVRMVRYTETALGRNPTQIDYADYRDLDGVKSPFRWTIARPSGSFTIRVEQAQQNVEVDEQKFAKPTETASPKTGK